MDHGDDKQKMTPPAAAEGEARREFLKKLGKASVTAPAIGLLMAANFKSAHAGPQYGGNGGGCGSGSS